MDDIDSVGSDEWWDREVAAAPVTKFTSPPGGRDLPGTDDGMGYLARPAGGGGYLARSAGRPTAKARATLSEAFIRGPIPVAWMRDAAALGSSALRTGIALWFVAGCRRNPSSLRLTAECRDLLGLSRTDVSRGLAKLESAGLVAIQRTSKQAAPAVSLKRVPPDFRHSR